MSKFPDGREFSFTRKEVWSEAAKNTKQQIVYDAPAHDHRKSPLHLMNDPKLIHPCKTNCGRFQSKESSNIFDLLDICVMFFFRWEFVAAIETPWMFSLTKRYWLWWDPKACRSPEFSLGGRHCHSFWGRGVIQQHLKILYPWYHKAVYEMAKINMF